MQQEILQKLESYPDYIAERMLIIREMIYAQADLLDINKLEETLKWGQVSYLAKQGSTIRLGYNASQEGQFSLFFNCKSLLIETFKTLYPDAFHYVGNREIRFSVDQPLPEKELQHCLRMALTYHKIKNRPLLGN
jgi:hypothetical protein